MVSRVLATVITVCVRYQGVVSRVLTYLSQYKLGIKVC